MKKSITLDKLLSIPQVKRKELLKTIRNEEKRKLYDNVITLTEILKLDKITSYKRRVELRNKHILKNPNAVFWE